MIIILKRKDEFNNQNPKVTTNRSMIKRSTKRSRLAKSSIPLLKYPKHLIYKVGCGGPAEPPGDHIYTSLSLP